MTRTLFFLAFLAVAASAAAPRAADDSPTPTSDVAAPATVDQMTLLPEYVGQPPIIVDATCCKICRKGKACGDSCISRSKTCRKPPGCACDAR